MTDLLKKFPLRSEARFCLWRYETDKNGRKTKIPYNPLTLERAQSNRPETFTSFETAAQILAIYKDRFTGLGIGLFGDICAIDIDHCRNKETGELTATAREIIKTIDRYTEASPSGEGVHIIFTAPRLAEIIGEATGRECKSIEELKAAFLSRWNIRTSGLEFYARFTPRYITVTGDALEGRGGNLMDLELRGEGKNLEKHRVTGRLIYVLDKFYRKGGDLDALPSVDVTSRPVQSLSLSDKEIIERASNAKNGREFRALWEGDIKRFEGAGNQSSADLALMSLLAFWTGGDRNRMEALFNQSALARREKWRRPDYRERTITAALKGMKNFYNPEDYYHSNPEDDFSPEPDEDEAPASSQNKREKTPEELKAEHLGASAIFNINEFFSDIRERAATPAISTGFRRLDNALDGGLYEGLYIIGGISSVGKTAFCLQLADQIAERGKDVIIFSLEMSQFELMARSLSRGTFQLLKQREGYKRYNPDKFYKYAKTARGITSFDRWKYYRREETDLITEAAENYKKAARHLWILEGMGTTGVIDTKDPAGKINAGIRSIVQAHSVYTGAAPVVIVDYLQILEPYSERMTDKQNTDKAVKLLKIMSRDFKIPVIAISSFNRANYKTAVDMEAFKESGAIEYSSDVLIGLQLEGAGAKDFNAAAEKSRDPRNIEALILKNRNGATGITLNYHYYPKYNAYREYEKNPPEASPSSTDDDEGRPPVE